MFDVYLFIIPAVKDNGGTSELERIFKIIWHSLTQTGFSRILRSTNIFLVYKFFARFRILTSPFNGDINTFSEHSGHLNTDLEQCNLRTAFMGFLLLLLLGGSHPKGTRT